MGLGPERASRMCPLGLLERLGVRLALHSDFTMAPANPLLLAWCAVNRLTVEDEAGQSRTPELCISPYTAIRGQSVSHIDKDDASTMSVLKLYSGNSVF